MTRVKICGITNLDDARAAVDAGADALGFIAVETSPRFVNDDTFHDVATSVPIFVSCVAVVSRLEDAEDYTRGYVQYYEDTSKDIQVSIEGFAMPIRAFRIRDEVSLRKLADYRARTVAILLDTYHKDKLGGSGEAFDWQLAVEAKKLTDRPIILAGGLTPENVTDALEIVRPYAVDVSSGVEASPGVKDHAKVRAFVRAVRTWDLQQRSNEG